MLNDFPKRYVFNVRLHTPYKISFQTHTKQLQQTLVAATVQNMLDNNFDGTKLKHWNTCAASSSDIGNVKCTKEFSHRLSFFSLSFSRFLLLLDRANISIYYIVSIGFYLTKNTELLHNLIVSFMLSQIFQYPFWNVVVQFSTQPNIYKTATHSIGNGSCSVTIFTLNCSGARVVEKATPMNQYFVPNTFFKCKYNGNESKLL